MYVIYEILKYSVSISSRNRINSNWYRNRLIYEFFIVFQKLYSWINWQKIMVVLASQKSIEQLKFSFFSYEDSLIQ